MSDEDLKLCPFCAEKLDKHGCVTHDGVVTDYYIHPAPDEVSDDECPLCGCVFRAKTWNRRPLETAALDEIERLREALVVLMQFHPEDELGPTTEEYWSPEYKAAMDAARAALGTQEAEG